MINDIVKLNEWQPELTLGEKALGLDNYTCQSGSKHNRCNHVLYTCSGVDIVLRNSFRNPI